MWVFTVKFFNFSVFETFHRKIFENLHAHDNFSYILSIGERKTGRKWHEWVFVPIKILDIYFSWFL